MRLFVTFFLLFLGLGGNLFAQIDPDSTVVADNPSQPDTKIDLHLNLSVGDNYLYATEFSQNIVQEIMGARIETRQQMKTDYRYEVESNDGNSLKIKATYERLFMEIEAPQGNFTFDSENPQQDSELTKLSGLIGKPFYIYMNSEGKITKVEGYNELIDSLDLNDATETIMTDSMWTSSIDMHFYATHPVGMGESWNKVQSYGFGNLQLLSDLTYTLEGISEDLAWLNVSGEVSAKGAEHGFDIELTGTQNGTLETDIETGMVSSGDINMDIDGVINSQGFEVPIKMNTNMKMSGTKL